MMSTRVPEDRSGLTMINVATCEISVESVYYTGNLKYLQVSLTC